MDTHVFGICRAGFSRGQRLGPGSKKGSVWISTQVFRVHPVFSFLFDGAYYADNTCFLSLESSLLSPLALFSGLSSVGANSRFSFLLFGEDADFPLPPSDGMTFLLRLPMQMLAATVCYSPASVYGTTTLRSLFIRLTIPFFICLLFPFS